MNPLESELHYPFGDTLPAQGTTHQVAPGVFWLRMGLPFALDHVNLWLLEDRIATPTGMRDGWTVIDCGIATDATRAAWQQIFDTQLNGKPIVRVIATHCHPDHIGLAHWLCERWDASLWMSAGEYAFAHMMAAAMPGTDGAAMLAHFRRHGVVDAATHDKLQARKHYYPTLVPALPSAYVRLQHDADIAIGGRSWRIITGFGHSPEHVALYCKDAGLLVSGDMLLPRISTNVSVFPVEPEADPVQLFVDSLARLADLPPDTLVLPSHGKPFTGLRQRVAQLRAHHAARLDEVLAACATPQSAADIVPLMFKRPLDAHQLTFALGEALAHLHRLWHAGQLRRQAGPDGVIRFVRNGEAENYPGTI